MSIGQSLFENPTAPLEFHIEKGKEEVLPEAFKADPFGYFEREGKNIKPGEIKYKEDGSVSDDPTAVKELPVWHDTSGKKIEVVGKKVNLEKSMIHKSGNPAYEYDLIKHIRSKGLSSATPIAFVSRGNEHLVLTERIKGYPWNSKTKLILEGKGYTVEDMAQLEASADELMKKLKADFEKAGIIRKAWELKDMVIEIDPETRKAIKVTPTDWEKTRYEQ